VPDGTAVFSVIGSFGVKSWMKLDDGLLTESGVCSGSFSPPGACNVYVGIWSPAAWKAYTNGGPLDPLWCFSSNDSGCQNVSGAYVSSPNLEAFDGVSCELVVWNVASFQLSGEYQFGVYTNLPN
jgi:hypothetical protein